MTSTSDTSVTAIIKSDRSGRTHYSSEFRAEVLAAFEQSSMSGQAFAEHHGIKYPTFASWRAKARRASHQLDSNSTSSPFIFAELASASAHPGPGLDIQLPGGATARLCDTTSVELLAALIKALA